MGSRLPPFARDLMAKRRRGLAPARDLYIAADWNVGKTWAWRIVVAVDEEPSALDFSVCAGLSCLLGGYDQARMDAIARAVIPYGPKRLYGVVYGTHGRLYLPSELLEECAA